MAAKLIPTTRKEKLPEGFSYPLGAEAISAGLEGIPQFDVAEIWFHWRDEYWVSRWRKRLDGHGVITLLRVSYFEYSEHWHIDVYSVPAQYSAMARQHLLAELPRIHAELSAAGPASKRVRLSVAFSLSQIDAVVRERGARRALYQMLRNPAKGHLGGNR
jgi:hypothetical protein